MFPNYLSISYVKQHIFKVFIIWAFISPLLFIIRKLDESIANKTIFLSYSSSILSGLWRPSVSSIKSHLTYALFSISLGNFCKVKYIPLVHLPAFVKNCVPNAKFIKVDFPEDCGPITLTTKTLSFLHYFITS